jgi:hypothetical protein
VSRPHKPGAAASKFGEGAVEDRVKCDFPPFGYINGRKARRVRHRRGEAIRDARSAGKSVT